VADVELPVAAEAIARRDAGEQPTAAIDVRSLFEGAQAPSTESQESVEAPGGDADAAIPVAAGDASAAAPPGPAATDAPIDLLGDAAGVEAHVLDDDAFFASLRDAVRDNEPLGPREEEGVGVGFFDQDRGEEAASFRDVFRRRR
jgi:hypothetical protein